MTHDPKHPFVPYRPARLPPDEALGRGRAFLQTMEARRSVRHFSDEPVPREAIELAIRTASTAPSGAHRQPWRFVVVDDPAIKHRVRVAAEQEERQSYEGGRMSEEWLEALAPLGTDWHKPYLETVPYLVVVFEEIHGFHPNRRFVAQWETAHFGGDTNDLIRVQAMLDEATGQIHVCYPDTLSAGNAGDNGAQATSGIQQNSMNGFQYSCNTPDLTNGTLLLYIPN
jgi:nitroreductase